MTTFPVNVRTTLTAENLADAAAALQVLAGQVVKIQGWYDVDDTPEYEAVVVSVEYQPDAGIVAISGVMVNDRYPKYQKFTRHITVGHGLKPGTDGGFDFHYGSTSFEYYIAIAI